MKPRAPVGDDRRWCGILPRDVSEYRADIDRFLPGVVVTFRAEQLLQWARDMTPASGGR